MAPARGIPADILALSVPIVFAAGAFSTMLYRVIRVSGQGAGRGNRALPPSLFATQEALLAP